MSDAPTTRRRSPRRSSRTPPAKRKKLERTPTVELEEEKTEEKTEKQAKLDRKTTSFLEEFDSGVDNNILCSLSIQNKQNLLLKLSSIMNPTLTEQRYTNLHTREGILIEVPFPKDVERTEAQTFYDQPTKIILFIFSYLSNIDRLCFGLSCKHMMYLLSNFVGVQGRRKIVKLNIWRFGSKYSKITSNVDVIGRMEDYVLDNAEPPTGLVADFVKQIKILLQRDYNWNEAYQGILNPSRAVCQPADLSLSLYDYQAMALTWMLIIERKVRNREKFAFSSLLSVPSSSGLYIDTSVFDNSTRIIHSDDPEIYLSAKYQKTFSLQGGMFADEMGLGKTITTIALILSNPRIKQNNGEYAPSHTNGCVRPFFESKATLILCPSQLVAQWAKEISSHTPLVVYTAATAAQHKKLCYSTVCDADIVIVAYKFISSNTTYSNLCDRREGTGSWAKYGVEQEEPELDHFQPLFHLIGWHRIVLDEGHEILSNCACSLAISKLQSTYRWYVTGTPLPEKQYSLDNVLEFLNFQSDNWILKFHDTFSKVILGRAVKRAVFWRNTKESVQNQIQIPPVIEEIELVSLSPIEQTIYDSMCFDERSESKRRQFVGEPTKFCHFGALDDPSLPQKYIEYYKIELKRLKKRLKEARKTLEEAQLVRPRDVTVRRRIEYYQSFVDRYEKDIMNTLCKSACFSRLVIGENSEEYCDACDVFVAGGTRLLCEHQMCSECIQKILMTQGPCACLKCNAAIVFDKLKICDNSLPDLLVDSIESEQDAWANELRVKYGTKFSATAKYLLNVMSYSEEVKMIVFSQYDSALMTLSSVLEGVDPKTFQNRMVMCKGNVHARKKQLDRFNDTGPDAARILLLSLTNSASGTHLACATHVLLLDPVVGTEGVARATDAQAIARAHRLGQGELVTAVRFIVLRTIDQEDYENAYGAVHVRTGPKSARK